MRMNRPSFLQIFVLWLGIFLISKTDNFAQSQNIIWEGYPVYSEILPDGNILHLSDSSGFLLPVITDTEGTLIARPGNLGTYSTEVPCVTKTPPGTYLFSRDGELLKYSIQGELVSTVSLENIPDNFQTKDSYGFGNLLTGGYVGVFKDDDMTSGGINLVFLDLAGYVMTMIPIESNLARYELKDAKISNDSEAGFNVEFIFSSGTEEEYQIRKIDAFGNIKWSGNILTTGEHFLSLKNMYSFEKSDLSMLNFSDRNDFKKGHFKAFNFDKVGNILFEKTFPENPENDNRKIIGHAAQIIDNQDFAFIYESFRNTETPDDELGIFVEKIAEPGNFIERTFTKGFAVQDNRIASQRPSMFKNEMGCYTLFSAKDGNMISSEPTTQNCGPQSLEPIDLELTLEAGTLTPEIYQDLPIFLTISNTGTGKAENIDVHMPLADELAFSGVEIPRGDFNNISGFWSIPELEAGESLELKINLFTLSVEQISVFAQVTAADQLDDDSTPDNNFSGIAEEDDEALVVLNSVGGLPDLFIENIEVIGDFFADSTSTLTFDLGNRGTDPAIGEYEIAAYFSTNRTLNDTDENIGVALAENTPIGQLSGQMIDIKIPAQIAAGNYFIILKADDLEVIIEANETNNVFAKAITVKGQTTGVPTMPDLEVEITSFEPTFDIFIPTNFTVKISNKGGEEATDIIVAFPFPDEMAFVEAFSSDGEFNYWLKHWNIEKLAPNQSQTLTITLFPIADSQPVILFAQVTQALPGDFDSTPGNADCCIAREDDEAAVTIIPNRSVAPRSSSLQNFKHKSLSVLKMYPNPATDFIQVKAFSNEEFINYLLVDSKGSILQKGIVEGTGVQDWKFDISNLPGGFYGILFQTAGKIERTSFLKVRE